MRIGFDVSELNGVPGGVRTAIQLVLAAVHKYESGVELIALAPRETKVPQGIRMVATGGPSRPRYWRKSHALAEAAEKIDLFHSPVLAHPVFERTPVVVTVHELPFVVSHRLEGARAAWLSGQHDVMRARIAVVTERGRSLLDRVRAREIAIQALVSQERLGDAVREALTVLSELGHPGIVRILDRGNNGEGIDYLVMELIEGTSLQDYVGLYQEKT